MSRNDYSEINLHIVWHTKNSLPLLTPDVETATHQSLPTQVGSVNQGYHTVMRDLGKRRQFSQLQDRGRDGSRRVQSPRFSVSESSPPYGGLDTELTTPQVRTIAPYGGRDSSLRSE